MPNFRRAGALGEDRAASYLLHKGYTLVTRRWCTRGGEIDLIALDGETLVFVEVKSRNGRWSSPEEAISDVKVSRFLNAVERYLIESEQVGRPIRFDVIAIDPQGLRHYEDAFRS